MASAQRATFLEAWRLRGRLGGLDDLVERVRTGEPVRDAPRKGHVHPAVQAVDIRHRGAGESGELVERGAGVDPADVLLDQGAGVRQPDKVDHVRLVLAYLVHV